MEKWQIADNLKYLIYNYADLRCEIFYFRISNNLADTIDSKEYKNLESKKLNMQKEIDSLLSQLQK